MDADQDIPLFLTRVDFVAVNRLAGQFIAAITAHQKAQPFCRATELEIVTALADTVAAALSVTSTDASALRATFLRQLESGLAMTASWSAPAEALPLPAFLPRRLS